MERVVPLFGFSPDRPAASRGYYLLMVMMLIPFVNYGALSGRGEALFQATPLRRMTAGMLAAAASFVAVGLSSSVSTSRASARFPSSGSSFRTHHHARRGPGCTYGLEFAYTQAPKRMKSTIMGFGLDGDGRQRARLDHLEDEAAQAQFFWVFAGLMAGAGALFGLRAYFYKQQDFIQD